MLTELGKALEFLQEMNRRHQFVSQRTGALHQACEQLVEEEVRYTLWIMVYMYMYTLKVYCFNNNKNNNNMSDTELT